MGAKSVKRIFSRNPAVVLGLVATILSAVAEQAAADGATWRSLVPILVSVVTRHFVWSPASVEKTVEEIYASGLVFVKDQKNG